MNNNLGIIKSIRNTKSYPELFNLAQQHYTKITRKDRALIFNTLITSLLIKAENNFGPKTSVKVLDDYINNIMNLHASDIKNYILVNNVSFVNKIAATYLFFNESNSSEDGQFNIDNKNNNIVLSPLLAIELIIFYECVAQSIRLIRKNNQSNIEDQNAYDELYSLNYIYDKSEQDLGDYLEYFRENDKYTKNIYGFSLYKLNLFLTILINHVPEKNLKESNLHTTPLFISNDYFNKIINQLSLNKQNIDKLFLDLNHNQNEFEIKYITDNKTKIKFFYPNEIQKQMDNHGFIGAKMDSGYFVPNNIYTLHPLYQKISNYANKKDSNKKGHNFETRVRNVLTMLFKKKPQSYITITLYRQLIQISILKKTF